MKRIGLVLVMMSLWGNAVFGQGLGWEWERQAGGIYRDDAKAVTTDAAGNVYVTGRFESPIIMFGTDTLTRAGTFDIFIAKYDAAGNLVWVKRFGGTNEDIGNSVVTDASGIYLTGTFKSPTIQFDTYTLTNTAMNIEDIFVAKFDFNGNVIWAKNAGGTWGDFSNSIAVNVSGVFITGYFISPSIIFNTDTLTNSVGWNVFVMKFDLNGNEQWARQGVGTGHDFSKSITADTSGAYITGEFDDTTIVFGSYTLHNYPLSTSHDIFIVKYDLNGNVLWVKRGSGDADDNGTAITSDLTGIYITGSSSSVYFAIGGVGFASFSMGGADMFVLKLASDGSTIWLKRVRVPAANEIPKAIITDVSGVYITGNFDGFIYFASDTIMTRGASDVFLLKYDLNGTEYWVKDVGGTSYDYGTSVATDVFGDVYLAGYYQSPDLFFDALSIHNSHGLDEIYLAKINLASSISELPHQSTITLFPNPTTISITITSTDKIESLKVHNVLGELLITETPNNNQSTININQFSSGIYFAEIKTEKGIVRKKVVKE